MTILSIIKLVFLICVLGSLVLVFTIHKKDEHNHNNPNYLTSKIREKENLLSLMIKSSHSVGFDSKRAYEIETIRSEICDLYVCLEKTRSKSE